MSTASPNPRFLTVVQWPAAMDRRGVAEVVAQGTRTDAETIRLRLGKGPPSIVGVFDADAAAGGAQAVIRAGGDAFAPAMSDIEALGPTRKLRDLRLGNGAFDVDIWRGESTSIPFDTIDVLVRVQLSETKIDRRAPMHLEGWGGRLHAPTTSFALGGAAGLAIGFGAAYAHDDLAASARTTTTTSDKLDVHTADGRVYQIDGDKFGFRILGDQRAMSDNRNVDLMGELISHVAPDVVIDPYFTMWNPPSGHHRMQLPNMSINRDDPAFAFYSRWAALMYRYVMHGTAK